ncbi:MAG: hypothetical protein HOC91_08245 [Nitrospinaceae bacterium]|jgi:hypothetical protein|nr:hypothetical protein [Nitrospinaceae bacterium]MBT3434280.1 hypothetical protein [Nitrospinaceae bacterium]MBT3822939.1 hypothetical protein [Nitrospinaceae bacterium]MBT4093739.1 hypothetical protein [Nitrospinaceae bacterium]MBT4430489.1 hypothetical protein [Nitrospinaceae bacterium]
MVDSIQVAAQGGKPLPAGPKGPETTAAFPVSSKVIAASVGGKDTFPTKPARLTQNLQQKSLKTNFLREGGRGANVNLIT